MEKNDDDDICDGNDNGDDGWRKRIVVVLSLL